MVTTLAIILNATILVALLITAISVLAMTWRRR
jgi:hypothetical protein